MIGFHWQENEYSYMSNWYKTSFEYGMRTYNCVEQYMMYQKAAIFKMWDIAEEIMNTDDPATMQKLGRTKSENFDAKVWEDTCYEVVKCGVLHKFEQNKELREKLLSTGQSILVECAGSDTKWGIGINIRDDSWKNVANWKGRNLLGRALMEVREELRRRSQIADITFKNAIELPANDIWNLKANEVMKNPVFHKVVKTYYDTLARLDDHAKSVFLNKYSLQDWDVAMKTNMGGGLPIAFFFEMKQEIYDSLRY